MSGQEMKTGEPRAKQMPYPLYSPASQKQLFLLIGISLKWLLFLQIFTEWLMLDTVFSEGG